MRAKRYLIILGIFGILTSVFLIVDWQYAFAWFDLREDPALLKAYKNLNIALDAYEKTGNSKIMDQWASTASLDAGPGMIEGARLTRWAIAHPSQFAKFMSQIRKENSDRLVTTVSFSIYEMQLQNEFEKAFASIEFPVKKEILQSVNETMKAAEGYKKK